MHLLPLHTPQHPTKPTTKRSAPIAAKERVSSVAMFLVNTLYTDTLVRWEIDTVRVGEFEFEFLQH